ncbi:vacuolar protein-sorting-associated protein 25-like [Musca domestica]|uniref:Vacuolar protein-sorting-associated protein 25 n=1 Tax=Musca domestica TaxID=7370 RepID=A0A1I8MF28_MUSDO|nr:vacuolar protein-sorting-associated protein 25 [Musca domestica]XP_058980719.1 vacuolar protein-sorting-associated protein 25-like [Musca domestica]
MTDFQWPWEYTFPPFFTLQPHEETRQQQLNVWSELFLKYLKHLNKFTVNINEGSFPLYYNESLNRRLSPSMILQILQKLQSTGHAQPLDKKRQEWQVYWHTLEEYGNMIYDWIQETGQTGSVCTLYEIANGESTEDKEFHGIDENVLVNVLRLLEDKGRCELIEMDGSYGVKFF